MRFIHTVLIVIVALFCLSEAAHFVRSRRAINPFLDSMGKRGLNPFLDSVGKRSAPVTDDDYFPLSDDHKQKRYFDSLAGQSLGKRSVSVPYELFY